MKTNNRYVVKPEKIHSLKDLELEKQRLRLEIMKTETTIRASYHNLLHAFTFRNLATSLVQDISATSSAFSKAVAIGKSFFHRKKKKPRKDEIQETH